MVILKALRAKSSPDLLKMLTESHGKLFEQVWLAVKARKDTKCAICWGDIFVGMRCFRPMTNANNRSNRIHASHIESDIPSGACGLGLWEHQKELKP